jgi:diguanylate cyclase (GGDEF)-like protein/PAS domain S-box-containing protein
MSFAITNESAYRLLVQNVTDYAIYMLTPDGTVSNWNAGAERAKGYKAEEIVGKHFSTFYGAEDRQKGLPQRALATALATGHFEGEGWRYRKDGSRFIANVIIDPIYDEDKVFIGFAKITRDMTLVRKQMDELRAVKENLNLALSHMSQGLCLFNAREQLVLCNTRFYEILDLAPELFQPGATYTDLLWHLYTSTTDDPISVANRIRDTRTTHFDRLGNSDQIITVEEAWKGRNLSVHHRRLPDGGWVSTLEDVTDKKIIESRIIHLASHDTLTELSNRLSFRDQVERRLAKSSTCALLYMDLDRFKPVNDMLGHAAGDHVLQVVAERIGVQLRKSDVGARLGGDEFAILLSDCSNELDASAVALRLIREISSPIHIEDVEVTVGISIGLVFAPLHGTDVDILLRNADLALYAAKQAGRGCYKTYQEGMESQLEQRSSLERDLRAALNRNEFHLHYQPVLNVQTDKVTSFEALLRWDSPTRGNVPPPEFIPFAEEIGFMTEIGDWVLRTACAEASKWDNDVCISVNLSPTQFCMPDLLGSISSILEETGLPPHRLELEITETSMIDDVPHAHGVLSALRKKGIQIALDDFGTGYSSLSFLRKLPFTRIKIDKSFVQDIDRNPGALAIIKAVTSLCNGLGVAATAEGVETAGQMAILRSEGCSEVQGYLISRPTAPEAARAWLSDYEDNAPNRAALTLAARA